MGAAVVAGVDASPVLEPAEHVLDSVALAIERGIVWDRHLAVCLCGDAGGDFALCQGDPKLVGILALVAEQDLGIGEGVYHQRGTFIVAHLTFAEQHDERPALATAWSLEFNPPLVRPIRLGTSPF